MNTSEIIDKVVDAIEDASFTRERILGFVNKGIGRVAAALPVPDLAASAILDLVSGQPHIILPENYHSHLFWAHNLSTDRPIEIVSPFTNFLRRFPSATRNDDVRVICAHGKKLFYQGNVFGAPGDTTLISVFYHHRPEQLEDGDDIEFLEESFVEDLLVNFAAAECYNLIETGIEGVKVNFNKFMSLYTLAVEDYRAFIGLPEENPDFVQQDFSEPDPSV